MLSRILLISLLFLPGIISAQSSADTATSDWKAHADKGYVILDWSWEKINSQVTVEISMVNPYPKDISAAWFSFSAFAKGDSTKDIRTKKPTILIHSTRLHTASGGYIDYKFEKVFNSKLVDEIRIVKVKLQFADGSIRIIDGNKAVGE